MYLERGPKYLLEHYKTRITGIDHYIIPQPSSRHTNRTGKHSVVESVFQTNYAVGFTSALNPARFNRGFR